MDSAVPTYASSRAASRRAAVLWLIVLVQLAIPSSYYFWRADHEDERFAWRMFSALRFRSCQVQVFDEREGQRQPVTLATALHASWIGALRRGRRRVIERFMASRCEPGGVDSITLVRSCVEVDGSHVPEQRFYYSCRLRSMTVDALEAAQ